jgi:hypothetical protein
MSFRVIDGDGPGKDELKFEREKRFAEHEFLQAMRLATANLLRVIRGAGRPEELLHQLSDVLRTALKVQDSTGRLPVDVMTSLLHGKSETESIWEKRHKGEIDEASITRWQEDGTIDKLYAEEAIQAGLLQIIASKLVHQDLQRRAGETELRDGIRNWIEVRERRMLKAREAAKAARPLPAKRKPRKPGGPVVL